MRNHWSIASSCCLGLLTGMLIGLSGSPVVATVAGAITAALGVFLGFKKSEMKSGEPQVQLTCFAFCCAVAVVSFMYVRTHNVLGATIVDERPSLRAEFELWKQLPNVSDDEAKALVVYRRLKALPPGWIAVKPPAVDPAAGILFKYSTTSDECDLLSPDRYKSEDRRIKAIEESLQSRPNVRMQKLLSTLTGEQKPELKKATVAGARLWGGC